MLERNLSDGIVAYRITACQYNQSWNRATNANQNRFFFVLLEVLPSNMACFVLRTEKRWSILGMVVPLSESSELRDWSWMHFLSNSECFDENCATLIRFIINPEHPQDLNVSTASQPSPFVEVLSLNQILNKHPPLAPPHSPTALSDLTTGTDLHSPIPHNM
jgi:hypothetical protein